MQSLRSSRRSLILVSAILALLLALPALAFAASPHFLSASGSVDKDGNLVVSFKEAGLGTTTTTETISLTADGTADYACINGGSNHPKASNKETINGPVSGSGTFPVRNGQTTGSISAAPPSAGSFSCPNGQSLVLASVSYSNVVLTGLGGDTISLPGPFSLTLINLQ